MQLKTSPNPDLKADFLIYEPIFDPKEINFRHLEIRTWKKISKFSTHPNLYLSKVSDWLRSSSFSIYQSSVITDYWESLKCSKTVNFIDKDLKFFVQMSKVMLHDQGLFSCLLPLITPLLLELKQFIKSLFIKRFAIWKRFMKDLDQIYKVGEIHKFDRGRCCWAMVINWFSDWSQVANFEA